MPATPLVNENGAPHFIGDLAITPDNCVGLTKREMFAMHVMASAIGGVMANPDPQANATPNDTAELAVCYADALLKELEK